MHTHTVVLRSGREGSATDEAGSAEASGEALAVRRLFTADEVAAVLGVPRTFVYALARRGELPTVRVGERYVRFREQALERWIVAQESTRPQGTQ